MTQSAASFYILEPKQKRGFERQQSILEAGMELLNEHSLDELSMGLIAERANCSVGNLYKRFTNKEGFFKVLFDTARVRVDADTKKFHGSVHEDVSNLEEAVRKLIRFQIYICREYRGMIRALRLNLLKTNLKDARTLVPIREYGHDREFQFLKRYFSTEGNFDQCEEKIRFALRVNMDHLLEITVFETGRIGIYSELIEERCVTMVMAALKDAAQPLNE